jgi:transcriptional regulator GlxA family with amidase domain
MQTPLTYLTNWRMTIGADMLRDTDATIATVARNIGYENPFAFSVAFKRTDGSAHRSGAADAPTPTLQPLPKPKGIPERVDDLLTRGS